MKKQEMLRARGDAERLIERIDAVLGELNKTPPGFSSTYHYGSPASAALRRTSMELTRALAQMRRS